MCARCKTFDDFVENARRELGKKVTYELFASVFLNCSDDALRGYRNNQKRLKGGKAQAFLNQLRDYMDSATYEEVVSDLNDKRGRAREPGEEIRVHPDSWNKVKSHYQSWIDYFEERGTDQFVSAAGPIRFETFTLSGTLLRWRDRSRSRPFEVNRNVGMKDCYSEIDVYDEAIVTRRAVIAEECEGILRLELISSGCIVLDDDEAKHGTGTLKPNMATYSNTNRRVMSLEIAITRGMSEIEFTIRVFNGFQRGHESLANKLPHNVIADTLDMTMDFGPVNEYTQFREKLEAKIQDTKTVNAHEKVMWSQSENKNEFRAEYGGVTGPEVRIVMSWELKSVEHSDDNLLASENISFASSANGR